jgi:Lon protease-like protein
MRKELPARPNVEHLKSQAKDLRDAYRRQDPEARRRVHQCLPAAQQQGEPPSDIALHDAQSVVAREYGFKSWAELKEHVESRLAAAANVNALLAPHLGGPLPPDLQQALLAAVGQEVPAELPLDAALPLLPVRNAVLTAGAVAPLHVGRATSVAAIEAARAGAGALVILPQKDPSNEAPRQGDLHPVGCVAKLISVLPTGDQGLRIVVRAVQWARLESLVREEPYLEARVSRFEVQDESGPHIESLEKALRQRVSAFAATLPNPAPIVEMTSRMNALQLADATVANLPCRIEDKLDYTSVPTLGARLQYVIALIDRAA